MKLIGGAMLRRIFSVCLCVFAGLSFAQDPVFGTGGGGMMTIRIRIVGFQVHDLTQVLSITMTYIFSGKGICLFQRSGLAIR